MALLALPLGAQEASGPAAPQLKSASDASIFTRRDARAITLKIPAPRGQIVDREGEPLAQNEVAYEVALQFQQFENPDREYVVRWARSRLDALQKILPSLANKTDDEIYNHYKDRRWLPLYVSDQLSEKEAKVLEPKLVSGLILHPVYRRIYPGKGLAAHILGYTGIAGKLPTGPINYNEPLWEESEGRAGLEKLFDRTLTGEPGIKKLIFDENGNKLLEEQASRPRPGGTVVTTINLRWQKLAEDVLAKHCKRGAIVICDAITGEVLVMASRPTFDLNAFIPGISEKEFEALNKDPATPLHARAFQSAYPPGSCFKPVVALTGLNEGKVDADELINCPSGITLGNHTFNNWTKVPEGPIDVRRALARSCNPWFIQVGLRVGPSAFLGLARKLGFGEKTGLPLIGEEQGLIPSNDWMLKHQGRRLMDGDTANLSFGQGVMLVTPLQVAQCMAGIANGGALPKLHLIRQVQDPHGRVVQATYPERRTALGLDPHAVDVVRQGMGDVVNSGYGTARSAALSYATICGKTGTAQWGPESKNQRLAWFAGFMPLENPRYSFAVLYEGRPGEKVSGGRMAAPMIKAFFEPLKDEIKEVISPPPKAVVIAEEGGGDNIPKAIPVDSTSDGEIIEDTPAVPVQRAIPVEPLTPNRSPVDRLQPEPQPTQPDEPPKKALPVNENEIEEP